MVQGKLLEALELLSSPKAPERPPDPIEDLITKYLTSLVDEYQELLRGFPGAELDREKILRAMLVRGGIDAVRELGGLIGYLKDGKTID
jgi:hypothetical protein